MLLIRKQGGGYQYKVVEELGKGQFGTVFKAAEIDTKALKAIKVMRDDKNDENEMETMRQEDRILQSLNHPNIVKCERWHEEKNSVLIIMELAPHGTVRKWIETRKALEVFEARFVLLHVFRAAQYLHNTDIIHGDIKPDNLLIFTHMTIKLGDFGFATKLNGRKFLDKCFGTPSYLAPEVLIHRKVSKSTDVWAIGATFYEIIAGKPLVENIIGDGLNDYGLGRKLLKAKFRLDQPDSDAQHLLNGLLDSDHPSRITASAALRSPFLHNGFIPRSLPVTCLLQQPNMEELKIVAKRDEGIATWKLKGVRDLGDEREAVGGFVERALRFQNVSEPKVLKVSVKPNGTKTIFFRAAGTIEPQSFFDSRNQHSLQLERTESKTRKRTIDETNPSSSEQHSGIKCFDCSCHVQLQYVLICETCTSENAQTVVCGKCSYRNHGKAGHRVFLKMIYDKEQVTKKQVQESSAAQILILRREIENVKNEQEKHLLELKRLREEPVLTPAIADEIMADFEQIKTLNEYREKQLDQIFGKSKLAEE